jgi:hypothetical protein
MTPARVAAVPVTPAEIVPPGLAAPGASKA